MDTGAAEEFGRVYGILARLVKVHERGEAQINVNDLGDLKRMVKEGQDRVRSQGGGVRSKT